MIKVSQKIIPQKTIQRGLLYLRTLEPLIKEGREFVSSGELAKIIGLTDVQIRKDISCLGRSAGRPRVGYHVRHLKEILEEFVLQNTVHVALFGVGNLGSAIAKYSGFQNEKIKLVAAFEKNKKKIGRKINGVRIHSLRDASRIILKSHAEIGIIAVPKEFSQEVADIMSQSRLKGIINFSPVSIKVRSDIPVKNIDLSIEFLSFFCDINECRSKKHGGSKDAK